MGMGRETEGGGRVLRGRSGTGGRGTEMLVVVRVRAEVVVASPTVVVSSVGGGWGGSGTGGPLAISVSGGGLVEGNAEVSGSSPL